MKTSENLNLCPFVGAPLAVYFCDDISYPEYEQLWGLKSNFSLSSGKSDFVDLSECEAFVKKHTPEAWFIFDGDHTFYGFYGNFYGRHMTCWVSCETALEYAKKSIAHDILVNPSIINNVRFIIGLPSQQVLKHFYDSPILSGGCTTYPKGNHWVYSSRFNLGVAPKFFFLRTVQDYVAHIKNTDYERIGFVFEGFTMTCYLSCDSIALTEYAKKCIIENCLTSPKHIDLVRFVFGLPEM